MLVCNCLYTVASWRRLVVIDSEIERMVVQLLEHYHQKTEKKEQINRLTWAYRSRLWLFITAFTFKLSNTTGKRTVHEEVYLVTFFFLMKKKWKRKYDDTFQKWKDTQHFSGVGTRDLSTDINGVLSQLRYISLHFYFRNSYDCQKYKHLLTLQVLLFKTAIGTSCFPSFLDLKPKCFDQ